MSAIQIVEGDTFGRMGDDEYMTIGEVTKVNDLFVDVDFGDWVQRYPRASLSEFFFHYKRYLGSGECEGVMVADYRLGLAA